MLGSLLTSLVDVAKVVYRTTVFLLLREGEDCVYSGDCVIVVFDLAEDSTLKNILSVLVCNQKAN